MPAAVGDVVIYFINRTGKDAVASVTRRNDASHVCDRLVRRKETEWMDGPTSGIVEFHGEPVTKRVGRFVVQMEAA